MKAGNSLDLAETAVVGQHSQVTVQHSDVIDFAMWPAQRLWRDTVLLLDIMWPRSNQRERVLLEKHQFQLHNNNISIIGLNPREGKNWILYSEWLPERPRWAYLARSGLFALFPREENSVQSSTI